MAHYIIVNGKRVRADSVKPAKTSAKPAEKPVKKQEVASNDQTS